HRHDDAAGARFERLFALLRGAFGNARQWERAPEFDRAAQVRQLMRAERSVFQVERDPVVTGLPQDFRNRRMGNLHPRAECDAALVEARADLLNGLASVHRTHTWLNVWLNVGFASIMSEWRFETIRSPAFSRRRRDSSAWGSNASLISIAMPLMRLR